jgi:hypothetical protein
VLALQGVVAKKKKAGEGTRTLNIQLGSKVLVQRDKSP